MIENHTDTAVRQALQYLRANAIAAHRLGDGLQVSHLASTAIRRVNSEASRIKDNRLRGEHLLWAYVLGLYWSVDDYFGYLVDRGVNECPPEGLDIATRDLVSMLCDIIKHPHAEHDWSKFTFPARDNWCSGHVGDGIQLERLLGYTFLIELAWYENPNSSNWRKLWDKCNSSCEIAEFVHEFQVLYSRLESQASLFAGQIALGEEICSSLSQVEIELLRGWELHFNFEYAALDRLLSKVRPQIEIENSLYPNFFSLVHQTRFYTKDAEDQFVSLPRYRYAVSRQPAHAIADKRENAAIEATKELAIANFSGDAPSSNRWTRFRMAMLLQLQALRTWNLGEWFRGLSIRGEARVELAKFNFHSMVLDGFFDLLLSNGTTQLPKSDFYKQQFKLADFTTEDQRSEFVGKILQLPKRYWPGVADVVSFLSDAIPASSIPELVAWSLRVEESTPANPFGRQSLLRMWKDIVDFAIDPGSIVRPLAPALIQASRNPMLWQDLHNLICHGLRHCTNEEGSRILAALGECNYDPVFSQWRFSIAFNALTLKPDLTSEALSILHADLGENPSPYQWLLLNKHSDSLQIARPESASKQSLRSRVLRFLEHRSSLEGPSISMMAPTFSNEFGFYGWNRSDRELADALCAFIHNEKALLTDKIDVLKCLAKLVEAGPKTQKQRVVESCLRLLGKSMPGRNFGFEQQGPMSNLKVKDDIVPSLFRLLVDVIQSGVNENEVAVTREVFDWLPTVGLPERAEFAPRIIRLLLSLIAIHAPKDGNVALVLVGHVESVFTAALTKNPVGSVFVFKDVLFSDKRHADLWQKTKPTDLWRRTLLAQWSNHLKRLANHIDPDVRRVTAEAVARWIYSRLEFSQELMAALEVLAQDPRSRVRGAVSELASVTE